MISKTSTILGILVVLVLAASTVCAVEKSQAADPVWSKYSTEPQLSIAIKVREADFGPLTDEHRQPMLEFGLLCHMLPVLDGQRDGVSNPM